MTLTENIDAQLFKTDFEFIEKAYHSSSFQHGWPLNHIKNCLQYINAWHRYFLTPRFQIIYKKDIYEANFDFFTLQWHHQNSAYKINLQGTS